jgi:protein-S-isoprenylcysteine O-methyltransferase Ste14
VESFKKIDRSVQSKNRCFRYRWDRRCNAAPTNTVNMQYPPSTSRNLRLRVPPLALVALAGGLGWITARNVPLLNFEFSGRGELATTFALLGVTCCILGVASFRLARTTVNPMTPDATTALVVSGIYRVTRNPMYLGFLLLLVAEMVWLGNPIALSVAPAFVLYLNRFQIGPEEIALRSRFGAEFHSYAARVRRWI